VDLSFRYTRFDKSIVIFLLASFVGGLLSKLISLCNINKQCHDTHSSIRPHQKKRLPNIAGICIAGGKLHSSPWLVLLGTTYVNMVSVPTGDDRYMAFITTYPPNGTHVFNAARTSMYMLRERIHFLWKGHQTFLGPCALCVRSWPVLWQTRSPYLMISTVLK
jgi:hypothetical protein